MTDIETKLKELNIILPEVAKPVANYISCSKSGNLLYISGQLPKNENGIIKGKLGENISTPDAQIAARSCVLYLLSQAKNELGNLDLLKKCVKICVFVNSTFTFEEHSVVANGASDALVEILGDAGRHTRSSFGVASLPFGACVEVEAIFEI